MKFCQVLSGYFGDIGTKQRRAKCGFGQRNMMRGHERSCLVGLVGWEDEFMQSTDAPYSARCSVLYYSPPFRYELICAYVIHHFCLTAVPAKT